MTKDHEMRRRSPSGRLSHSQKFGMEKWIGAGDDKRIP